MSSAGPSTPDRFQSSPDRFQSPRRRGSLEKQKEDKFRGMRLAPAGGGGPGGNDPVPPAPGTGEFSPDSILFLNDSPFCTPLRWGWSTSGRVQRNRGGIRWHWALHDAEALNRPLYYLFCQHLNNCSDVNVNISTSPPFPLSAPRPTVAPGPPAVWGRCCDPPTACVPWRT